MRSRVIAISVMAVCAGWMPCSGGQAWAWTMDTSLSSSEASFLGERVDDWAGWGLAGAGDVNGDGYDDLLVGAPVEFDPHGGSLAPGEAYLILGDAAGWSMNLSLATSDASFEGEDVLDAAGTAVSGVGDVDGDGYDDFLVGAPHNSESDVWAGQTYLVLGRETGWVQGASLATADASFLGGSASDAAGWSVAGGDLDGDGLSDLVIGAQAMFQFPFQAGRLYVVFGQEVGWSMDTALSAADASYLGEDGGDEASWALAVAGDVNGDGYDDLLVGAPGSDDGGDDAGQAYLIFGRETGWTTGASLGTADASFLGEDEDAWAGFTVAGAGDVDGDGYDDLLVGAPHDGESGDEAGQAYLIFGADSGWAMDTSLAAADASFLGESGDDQAGYGLAGLGDLDGDAYDDFLVGAPFNDEAASGAGQTYLFRGAAAGWAMDTPLTSAEGSLLGESSNDNAGRRLAGPGDVNGDGFADLLIGAPRGSQAADEAGQAYLVLGVPTCFDGDGDGYGSPGVYTCPQGDAEDCDDLDPLVHPGAVEICDGKDNNCNGVTPQDELDADGDGVMGCEGDCDDAHADSYPGAAEICDGHDNDCDGLLPADEADADGDGSPVCADCDDADPTSYPSAPELCDGVDNNCNGVIAAWELDQDGDGWFECAGDCDDADPALNLDDVDGDGVDTCGGDCDDADGQVFPGAAEACNGADDDCDGALPADEADGDGDGWMSCAGDCDDADWAVNPAAAEACNGHDDDCDGETDEGDASGCTEFFLDADGDGYGLTGDSLCLCAGAAPYSAAVDGDCDDGAAGVNPGAVELCNGLDDDCDAVVDGAGAVDASTWYRDADGDGFGDPLDLLEDCDEPPGYGARAGDCDDTDAAIHPGAIEACDGVDNDCNGYLPAYDTDADGDGYSPCAGDCNDAAADQSPAVVEVICNGINDDCDTGTPDEPDEDGDGWSVCDGDCDDDDPYLDLNDADGDGWTTCDGDCDDHDPTLHPDDLDADGWSPCDGDCDDADPAMYPDDLDTDGWSPCEGDCDDGDPMLNLDDADADGADTCDGDCDDADATLNLEDVDGDGWHTCDGDCDDADAALNLDDRDGDGVDTCEDDCDDEDSWTFPGAPEQCDLLDNDCDGAVDEDVDVDLDGDGVNACQGDCDNNDANVHPGAVEICDGKDDDCDGDLPLDEADDDGDEWMVCEGDCDDADASLNLTDVDADGWSTCAGDCDDDDASLNLDDADGDGWSSCDGDCDDADPAVNIGDADGDGYTPCDGDCDDTSADAYPGNLELCDGLDNDCNGAVDDVDDDGDGYSPAECGGEDCDDNDADVHPDADEDCFDASDNDCDGAIDEDDPDCAGDDDDDADDDDATPADDDTDDVGLDAGCECSASGGSAPLPILGLLLSLALLRGRVRRRG